MTDEKSLLRCTIKKSVQVLERVIVSIASIVVGFALCGVAYLAITGILLPLGLIIVAIAVSISWYYYAGVIVLISIPAYSALWCVVRELTSEDWDSDEASALAAVLALGLALAAAVAAAFAAAAVALGLVLGLALGLAAAAVAVAAVLASDIDSRCMLFIGAVLHYRKRMRGVN